MIRITGGKHRSRKLLTPDTGLTKPTMDKVRAAVFNALGDKVINSKVLDLFSGSGSYGFEALSRDANFVTFIDKDKTAIKIIKENAATLKEENYEVYQEDVLSFLKQSKDKFDIVFVDPPYKLEVYEAVLDALENNELLNEDAVIVLESEKPLNIKEDNYKKVKLYSYGLAKIYMLRK